MSSKEEIVRLTASEMERLILARELSPVELMSACLEQIERYNPKINAVCTVSHRALQEAREAEEKLVKGREVGPLHGLPVGIKDVTPTAGLRTTYGSPLYVDHIPSEDALLVSRLKSAGAIVIGKTNTPEFAAGANTFNRVFGPTRNPWKSTLSAGGSTGGGAAALAAGMIALAEGTDLGGSLRIPASFCGVVGLRPCPGLVPTHPSDFLWDTICVSGPMARTAEDVALMLQSLAGSSPLSPLCQPVEQRDFMAAVRSGPEGGLRLAYCSDLSGIGLEGDIGGICRRAAFEMEQCGAVVEEIELDLSFARDAFLALRGLWMVAEHFDRLDQLDQLGENLAGNIRAGLDVTVRELGKAEKVRSRLWEIFSGLFERFDLLLTPCVAVVPFPVETNYPQTVAGRKMNSYVDWFAPTFVLSLTGLPIASVPCGLDENALPVGLQIVGQPIGEEKVLALAKRIQQACPIGWPPGV